MHSTLQNSHNSRLVINISFHSKICVPEESNNVDYLKETRSDSAHEYLLVLVPVFCAALGSGKS